MDISRKIKDLNMHKFTLLMLFCIIFGCTFSNAPINKDMKVEKGDGINSEEAIAIASMYVEKDDYYHEYYSVSRPKVKDSVLRENCWAVEFNPNVKGVLKAFYHLQVSVDKKTGGIRGAGVTK